MRQSPLPLPAEPSLSSEPSMDEILASIRQVISGEPEAKKPANKDADILDLTEALPEERKRGVSVSSHHEFQREAYIARKNALTDTVISQNVITESMQAFGPLHKLAQDLPKTPEPCLNEGIGGKTTEALMREILTPLLKEWLDKNLPSVVRWVVGEQVEKITRRLGVASAEPTFEKSKALTDE